jgi:FkbM family methyltransferase
MTNYWDKRFLEHLNITVGTIVEVGARYGDESIELSNCFPYARIYSFECNPRVVDRCKNMLMGHENITFLECGLGDVNEHRNFYSYIENNDGASSFYKRYDGDRTQVLTGSIEIRKLSDIMNEQFIDSIDLLCMDVQGYELNVLRGLGEKLKRVRYIIMEEPRRGVESKYRNACSSIEIEQYMRDNGFVEIVRIPENLVEDNVMYTRVSS